ncbi:hypothetical protein vseg_008078 [Gypsophila vaccaria]
MSSMATSSPSSSKLIFSTSPSPHHSSPHLLSFFPPTTSAAATAFFSLRWGNGDVGFGGRVRVSYTKRPMETPGAYEVIDEETGERVIVWGGVDDDEPTLLSKEVLSWNPNKYDKKSSRNADKSRDSERPSSRRDNTASGVTTRRLASSFGRLRPLKIRSSVRSVSPEKLETSNDKYDEIDTGETDDDDDQASSFNSEDMSKMRKKKISGKSGIDQLLDSQQSIKSLDSDGDVVALNVSPRSKVWNNREPTYSSRGEQRDQKYSSKYSAGVDFFSRKSFRNLSCSDDMIESLRAQDYVRPSHIQAMAYEPTVSGKSCIIADQSGSGKTLAYLAPVIQRLRQEEINGLSKSASRSPRAVILVPTAELASQVLRNCRSISKHGVPFRSIVATGGFRQRTQLESLEQDLDVLIVTPGRFMYLIKEGFLQLTNIRCAVLDEVDILFSDEDFEQAFQSLINSSPVTTQYLFVTATLPVDIYNKIVTIFPDCEVIMGPGMHRTSPGLEEVLVDCSGADGSEKTPETAFSNKKSALLKLAEENRVSRTIVFCNKIETCRKVENALKRLDRNENQVRVLPFHAALDQGTRLVNMKEFLNSVTGSRSQFLICTDRASRGIDFPSVDHVVLFDFPRDPSEYVRRVGRTARGAGGTGKAFVFVVGKQVSLARRIIERNLKGHPLHEVPSSYELVR